MKPSVWLLTLLLIVLLVFSGLAAWVTYQNRPENAGISTPYPSGQAVVPQAPESALQPAPTPTAAPPAAGQPFLVRYTAGDQTLTVEFLDNDLVHIELASSTSQGTGQAILTSPMVAKTEYPGPSSFQNDGKGTLETAGMKLLVNQETLCFTATDTAREPDLILSTFCPSKTPQKLYRLRWTPESFTHAYGLGEKFFDPGVMDGDWIGRERFPGKFGNVQEPFQYGNVGNDQFPVAYFAGRATESYALFFDNPYRQFFNFNKQPWNASFESPELRFYLLTGPDFPDLRKDYLELTGRPPVPPKSAFGLWVSEYGYENWAELEDKLRTLRENHFPVDGFVLDLQWYGGIRNDSDDTRMGSLRWDKTNFPNPEQEIAQLEDKQGVRIITIEQPYVGKNLPEHAEMEKLGYLVKDCVDCGAIYLDKNSITVAGGASGASGTTSQPKKSSWWGSGGMLDFTNPQGSAFWHDQRREPLIQAGVAGLWTDLGEPEIYNPKAWYWGIPEGDQLLHNHPAVHNLFNLLWSRSIWEGYTRNGHVERPFVLSRSGTSGSQRYGVAQWSGDIGSTLYALAAHLNVQMHMSMSGMDYYGADIGGFFRYAGDPYTEEMYTQWFADGMAFDVPGRVHTSNLQNQFETAPDRVGDLRSNLENVRQRYALSPYLYSLAHRAYLYGEPVFPPLVYYYQEDPQVRELGGEKLVGKDLLVAAVANYGQAVRQVYLPAGTWVNYHTGEWYASEGENFGPFPLYPDGQFRLPTFARAGAIIPQMWVDDQTMNLSGRRLDGSARDELILSVYADPAPSAFTLYEDDGRTMAYQKGEVRTTEITQQQEGNQVAVTAAASQGNYAGAPEERDTLVWLYTRAQGEPEEVTLGSEPLAEVQDLEALYLADRGWTAAQPGLVVAKAGRLPVAEAKELIFTFQEPAAAQASPTLAPLPPADPTRGWQPAVPEQVGIDSVQLARAIDTIQAKEWNLHELSIIRDGYQVLDAAFARPNSGSQFDHLAPTPPVISSLVGIAIDQGFMQNIDAPVLTYFPGLTVQNLDDRKRAITLKHLLTMTSGLNCDQFNQKISLDPLQGEDDWVQVLLDQPMEAAPGERFNYCPADVHLVSAVLSAVTGTSAGEFARQYLFTPLGITRFTWDTDPQGISLGWRGLKLDLADTAKIGYLYLHGGKWGGQQILSQGWVEAASRSQTPIFEKISIGYLWLVDDRNGQLYWFDHKGQRISMLVEKDLILVYTGMLRDFYENSGSILETNLLYPSVVSAAPLPDNPAGLESLQAKVSGAGQLHPQPLPTLPDTAGQISGRVYQLDKNSRGWNSVALTFVSGGAEARLVLGAGGQELEYPVGLDGLFRIHPEKEGLLEDFYIAMRGYWETEDVFVLEYENLYRPGKGSARLTFTGDRLDLALHDRVDGRASIQGQVE